MQVNDVNVTGDRAAAAAELLRKGKNNTGGWVCFCVARAHPTMCWAQTSAPVTGWVWFGTRGV